METRADFCIDYEERAALLKALANPVRLRILHVLRTEGCRNVRCIEARTGMSQSCISQHLQRLRSARLVGRSVWETRCSIRSRRRRWRSWSTP